MPSTFFTAALFISQDSHPYSSMDSTVDLKNLTFVSVVMREFQIFSRELRAFHVFPIQVLIFREELV